MPDYEIKEGFFWCGKGFEVTRDAFEEVGKEIMKVKKSVKKTKLRCGILSIALIGLGYFGYKLYEDQAKMKDRLYSLENRNNGDFEEFEGSSDDDI